MSGSRLRGAALGALLAFVAACGRTEPAISRDTAYAAADASADSLVLLARDDAPALDDEGVVFVGYLEQLRLGLGSPFRLVERALADARLRPAVRVRVARALLGRLAAGESYAAAALVDETLRLAGARRGGTGQGVDEGLIGRAVGAARSPWAGERGVRIAYALAMASGEAGDSALAYAAESAALWRDRALAADDVRRLYRVAVSRRVSAAALVAEWRRERRFAVETPPLAVTPEATDLEAVLVGLRLADSIGLPPPPAPPASRPAAPDTGARPDTAAARPDTAPPPPDTVSRPDPAMAPLLGPRTASRWVAIAERRGLPPRAAVVVELRTLRAPVVFGDDAGRRARAALVAEATDEESLAALHAVAWWAGGRRVGLARAMRRIAVALRAHAQEPLFSDPDPATLVDRVRRNHALRDFTFDAGVPAAWRPHQARMVERAIEDLRRVIPAVDVQGLRVHVGRTPFGDAALAAHEPTRRILFAPPASASGALAHELGHDLDWSAAARGYYRTDRFARREGSSLAAALERIAPDRLVAPGPEHRYRIDVETRPTEAFARSFDWFVAASLAAQGVSNGDLSTVQDELLPGRAGAVAPDHDGGAAAAMIHLVEALIPVPARVSRGYLARHGTARPRTVWEAVQGVRQVAAPPAASLGLDEEASLPLRDAALDAMAGAPPFPEGWCAPVASDRRSVRGADRAWLAARAMASARARGIVAAWERDPSRLPGGPVRAALAGAPRDPALRARLETRVCDALLARWSATTRPRFLERSVGAPAASLAD